MSSEKLVEIEKRKVTHFGKDLFTQSRTVHDFDGNPLLGGEMDAKLDDT